MSLAPVAVIFFRGGWCPYCSAQLSGLRKSEAQLRASGVQIIGVSSDSLETMRRHDISFQSGFKLLADPMLTAAKAFGVAYQPAEAEAASLKQYKIDLEKGAGAQARSPACALGVHRVEGRPHRIPLRQPRHRHPAR